MREEKRIALVLSGSGMRAIYFHVGALIRLNELGILPRVATISSASSSAILAAELGLGWRDLDFDERGIATNLQAMLMGQFERFQLPKPSTFSLMRAFFDVRAGPDLTAFFARSLMYGNATLGDLPKPDEGPAFVFNATNIQTGSRVEVTRRGLWDRRIGDLECPQLPIARVMAATGFYFPHPMPRIDCDKRAWREGGEVADLYAITAYREALYLTDSEILGDIGLEAVVESHDHVILSDANSKFVPSPEPKQSGIQLLGRFLELSSQDSRMRQIRHIDDNSAHWSIDDKIANHSGIDSITVDSDRYDELALIPIYARSINHADQGMLINWGYALSDAATQAAEWLDGPHATAWPAPDRALHPFGI